jgi:AAA+ superfamily predicted ATPase
LSLKLSRDIALRLAADIPADWLPEGFGYHPPRSGLLQRIVLDADVRQRVKAWSQSLKRPGPARPLILAGTPGAGRTETACAAVAELDLPLLSVELPAAQFIDRLRSARREARWHGAGLLLRIAPRLNGAPDWSEFWSGLANLQVPLIISTIPELAESLFLSGPGEAVLIKLEEPTLTARAALWEMMLPTEVKLPPDDLNRLAARFRFNPGRIKQAIRRAFALMAAPSGNSVTADSLLEACREVGSTAIGPLAQKVPLPYEWDELVVPPAVRSELELARTWAQNERQVLDRWGFARRLPTGRGLTMLFSGPPGTGKTMAAQVLTRAWGLDLYRVDVPRTVSKFIGDTEKNLSRLFDEAHASGAVLFFDEADAMFGKRSEVKDAHDRYANLEIGYLLQRMEEYEGITILASNRARDLDEAFVRRFHFMIDFPMPDEAHRLKIWEGMFPREAERDMDLDIRLFAKEFEISGGEIKNIVLAAAYIAAGENRPIRMADVQRAVRREFLKSGRVLNRRSLDIL